MEISLNKVCCSAVNEERKLNNVKEKNRHQF